MWPGVAELTSMPSMAAWASFLAGSGGLAVGIVLLDQVPGIDDRVELRPEVGVGDRPGRKRASRAVGKGAAEERASRPGSTGRASTREQGHGP